MDRCARFLLARHVQPDRIHRLLQLGQRFGISVQAFRRALRAAGLVSRTRRSHAADAGSTQRLMDTLSHRLLHRLGKAIDDRELSPTQLSRLGTCFAHNQQAFARLQAQRLAHKRYARERIAQRKKEIARGKHHPETRMTLEERVRRIYGIEMPGCTPSPKPQEEPSP